MNRSSRAEPQPARDATHQRSAGPKRPYTPPALSEYGSVAKLTRGASGAFAETGGHKKHACL